MRSALLILGFLVALGASSAVAQTSSTLEFNWDTDGTLRAKVTYNRRPERGCVLRLRAAVSGERQTRVLIAGRVVTYAPQRLGRVVKIGARGLPGVGRFSNGDPVLTLQAQTTCGNTKFTSNAVARFVKCGRAVPKVTAWEFIDVLRQRVR